MKASFVSSKGALHPVGEEAQQIIAAIPAGREVMVEIKPSRNPRQHRLFMALLGIVVENTDFFATKEAALTAVKMAIGEADPVVDPLTFETKWVLRSIAFESCDQARFSLIFEAALRVICERYLGGADMEEVRAEINRIADGEARSSIGKRLG